MQRRRSTVALGLVLAAFALVGTPVSAGAAPKAHAEPLETTDHYVVHTSEIPVIKGQVDHIYVQQTRFAKDQRATRGSIVLVHGATYPTETAFNLRYQDYSYTDFLAQQGFDVYTMDMEGYGPSSRPWPMEDPCNLSASDQQLVGPVTTQPCGDPSYAQVLSTNQAEWSALDSVVDWVRARDGVAKVNLVGWSMGGMRTGGYASSHPDKVNRLVLFAPAYSPTSPDGPPAEQPDGAPYTVSNHDQFLTRWNAEVDLTQCPGQVDPGAQEQMWQQNLAADPVAATWGEGFLRRPMSVNTGWNQPAAARVGAPTLLIAGDLDRTVPPESVYQLYSDLGSREKLYLQVHCGSHFMLAESQYRMLQQVTADWLEQQPIAGQRTGVVQSAQVVGGR
ncbi:alpha/beta hydrolase [Saccharopolyspora sp. 5N708]|uniref:alpha/beta hydrolase n=1 Tax=Saccharopolyspora sp. 5N708 TaxID=3457424 RepID=UPI003FCFC533